MLNAGFQLYWLKYHKPDLFKSINDTYGHMAGDKFLLEIAGLMRHHIVRKLRLVAPPEEDGGSAPEDHEHDRIP